MKRLDEIMNKICETASHFDILLSTFSIREFAKSQLVLVLGKETVS